MDPQQDRGAFSGLILNVLDTWAQSFGASAAGGLLLRVQSLMPPIYTFTRCCF